MSQECHRKIIKISYISCWINLWPVIYVRQKTPLASPYSFWYTYALRLVKVFHIWTVDLKVSASKVLQKIFGFIHGAYNAVIHGLDGSNMKLGLYKYSETFLEPFLKPFLGSKRIVHNIGFTVFSPLLCARDMPKCRWRVVHKCLFYNVFLGESEAKLCSPVRVEQEVFVS